MAKFGPVVPIQIARVLGREVMADYHLLLAHDILLRPDDYREVYDRKGQPMFILLDNSLIELGRPMDVEEMMKAAEVVNPSVIALPDYLGSTDQTLDAASAFYDKLGELQSPRPPLTGVVQGQSMNDCMRCASVMMYEMKLRMLCVPRILVEILGSRMMVVQALANKYPFTPVHLMGFSNNIIDDVACARMPNVIGIDSAVPIRSALRHGLDYLPLQLNYDPGPRGNYWDTPLDIAITHTRAIANVLATYRSWINVSYRD